jgi:membrane protein YqaA with SNARE-associated domain
LRFLHAFKSIYKKPEAKASLDYNNISNESKNNGVKRIRSFGEKSRLYHYIMKRQGQYSFIARNIVRMILGLGAFGLGAWAISTYLIDVQAVVGYISEHFSFWLIVGTLFLSESILGLLPPDAYLFWANEGFDPSWPVILLLAFTSYLGGIISYFIGKWLYRFPKVKRWVHIKFKEQFKLFKKFGGLLIFISAMTPLPFSPVSIVAGVIDYPFKTYLLTALSRFLRFFLYAYIFSQVIA